MKDGFFKVISASPEIKVADTDYNASVISESIKNAEEKGFTIAVFPELCLTGYTCGELFFQRTLTENAEKALMTIVENTKECEIVAVIGLPVYLRGKLFNSAAVICKGSILGVVPKSNLPNYGEFYERRYFEPAYKGTDVIDICGNETFFGTDLIFRDEKFPEMKIAVEICEDLWIPEPPSVRHALNGATIICNPSASDETIGKRNYRKQLVSSQSARLCCAYVYSDASEGESTTDMVFGGHNIIAENGRILSENQVFSQTPAEAVIDVQLLSEERKRMTTYPCASDDGYTVIDFSIKKTATDISIRELSATPFVPSDDKEKAARCEEIIEMQAHGLSKRIKHIKPESLVIGISGGLDSTLALLVSVKAADICGMPRISVLAVTMPCFGTTKRTKGNAYKLAEAAGCSIRDIDISAAVIQHFKDIGHNPGVLDVTYENSQARERTQVLMDIANQENGIVIGTGDMSELALGWATYNGDHMSMYAVNSSVPKTLVRHLVRYFAETTDNKALSGVLFDILDTPVSPELLPPVDGQISQKTEQLIGPYELHDFYMYYVIRYHYTPSKIFRLAKAAFAGKYEPETLQKWLCSFYRRFFTQQFKRSCMPDGPKIGSVTLSPRGDWRMPSDACVAIWLKEAESLL